MCQSPSNQLSFFNVCQPLSLRQIQWREPFESWKTPRDNFLKPPVGQNPQNWWADVWGVVFVPMWFRVSVPPCGWHLTPLNGDTGFPDRVAFGWMMPPRITHHLPSLTQTPLSYNSRHTHPPPILAFRRPFFRRRCRANCPDHESQMSPVTCPSRSRNQQVMRLKGKDVSKTSSPGNLTWLENPL